MDLRYGEVKGLFDGTALKLLRSDHAPLIIAFLDEIFIAGGSLDITESELTQRLDAFIARINQGGETEIPRRAKDYIKYWSSESQGFLRRFTKDESSEFYYEITPPAQKAAAFVLSLNSYRYVGTESRLISIIDLLKQMTLQRREDSREEYLAELERRKAALEQQIADVKAGRSAVLTEEQFYDRLQQFESLSHSLLSDLREVEYNLRQLYRSFRTEIETSQGPKDEHLASFFEKSDLIASSEQGSSARAFSRLLLSARDRAQLSAMLDELYRGPNLKELPHDERLRHLFKDLLHHAGLISEVIAAQDRELHAFINTRSYGQARAVQSLCRKLLQQVRERPELLEDKSEFQRLELPQAEVVLPCDRSLFTVPEPEELTQEPVSEGQAEALTQDDFAEVSLVDIDKLRTRLIMLLSQQGTVTLSELAEHYGMQYGAEELLSYLELAGEEFDVQRLEELLDEVSYAGTLKDGTYLRTVIELTRREISFKDSTAAPPAVNGSWEQDREFRLPGSAAEDNA